jgi:ribosomal protein S18 acetylase RimI-like enzyme
VQQRIESLGIDLRRAVASDLEAMAACDDKVFGWRAAGRKLRDTGPGSELASQVADGGILALSEDSRIVGFVAFERHFDLLYIATLAVLPSHQGRGLGRRLIAAAEREASRHGLRGVSLFADGRKPSTLGFYVSCGFHETERCVERDFQRVYFAKRLAA